MEKAPVTSNRSSAISLFRMHLLINKEPLMTALSPFIAPFKVHRRKLTFFVVAESRRISPLMSQSRSVRLLERKQLSRSKSPVKTRELTRIPLASMKAAACGSVAIHRRNAPSTEPCLVGPRTGLDESELVLSFMICLSSIVRERPSQVVARAERPVACRSWIVRIADGTSVLGSRGDD